MQDSDRVCVVIFALGLILLLYVQLAPEKTAVPEWEKPSASRPSTDIARWSPHPVSPDDSREESGVLIVRYPPAPGGPGQVTELTTFGKALSRLASRPDVRRMIEIGTWYGQGSTAVIGRAFKNTRDTPEKWSGKSGDLFFRFPERRAGNKFLWTLEIFEPAWQHARRFVAKEQLPVRCILGGTVDSSGVLPPSAIDEEEKRNPNSHYRQYYARDIALMMDSEPQLVSLCMRHMPIDAVLIDGNEYTGWAEYKVVDSICEPRFLALHDTNTLKTREIERVIANGATDWVLWDSGRDSVGWSIYVRGEYESVAHGVE